MTNLTNFQKRFDSNIRQFYKVGENPDSPASVKQQEVYDRLVSEMAQYVVKNTSGYFTCIKVAPDNEVFWEFVLEEVLQLNPDF